MNIKANVAGLVIALTSFVVMPHSAYSQFSPPGQAFFPGSIYA
ncbi:MAG TPA: hypothetical protein VGG18_08425 [Granulicella sp.]